MAKKKTSKISNSYLVAKTEDYKEIYVDNVVVQKAPKDIRLFLFRHDPLVDMTETKKTQEYSITALNTFVGHIIIPNGEIKHIVKGLQIILNEIEKEKIVPPKKSKKKKK